MNEKARPFQEGPVAGIYALAFMKLTPVAQAHGYALAAHGSFGRDLDLVAIPWAKIASEPEVLIDACAAALGWFKRDDKGSPGLKPHGRLAYNIIDMSTGCWVDLAVIPRQVQP